MAQGKGPEVRRKALAELLGTFALVFAGTGAIVVNDVSGGQVSHVGVSLTFGLVVMVMVFALGEISGAHLNPAVTLGFAVAGQLNWKTVPGYVAAQTAGAILASLFLKGLFPTHATLGSTVPAGSGAQSFALEIVLTFFLMTVVLSVSSGAKERGLAAPFAVGGVVAMEALFGGPISGASMNPARSLGPALVSGHPGYLWLYLTAPVIGSLFAVGTWKALTHSHGHARIEPNAHASPPGPLGPNA